jgi:hypothetical protein
VPTRCWSHSVRVTSDSSLVSVVLLAQGQRVFQNRPAETSTSEYVEVRWCSWWLSLSGGATLTFNLSTASVHLRGLTAPLWMVNPISWDDLPVAPIYMSATVTPAGRRLVCECGSHCATARPARATWLAAARLFGDTIDSVAPLRSGQALFLPAPDPPTVHAASSATCGPFAATSARG